MGLRAGQHLGGTGANHRCHVCRRRWRPMEQQAIQTLGAAAAAATATVLSLRKVPPPCLSSSPMPHPLALGLQSHSEMSASSPFQVRTQMRPLSKEIRCLWSFCPLQTQVLSTSNYPCSLSPQGTFLWLYVHYLMSGLQQLGLTLPRQRHWFLGSVPGQLQTPKQLASQKYPLSLEIHFLRHGFLWKDQISGTFL